MSISPEAARNQIYQLALSHPEGASVPPEMSQALGNSSFAADHLWVQNHREFLLQDYSDRWIAVRNQAVIDSDGDLEHLVARVPDAPRVCMHFLASHPVEMIL